MRQDLTDLTVVVDRSGSMSSIREDAEGGINEFISKQKALPGDCTFSLVQFDTQYEFVHKAVPIKGVPKYTLSPRGNTALLDAVGKAIAETGERLKSTPEADRPGLVVILIVTDGQENSSVEYKKAQIKEMIQHQQDAYKWQFSFLAANSDAFLDAADMGIALAGAANYSASNVKRAYMAASSNVGRMRSASAAGASIQNAYTDEEKQQMA